MKHEPCGRSFQTFCVRPKGHIGKCRTDWNISREGDS